MKNLMFKKVVQINNFFIFYFNKINEFIKVINHKFKNISSFNRYLIFLITVLFLYLFFLSIPSLYDKGSIQTKLNKKINEEFNINISLSSNINYNILPKPHFVIENTKLFTRDLDAPKELGQIKKLKVFINQKYFLHKSRTEITRLSMDQANFNITEKDFKHLRDFLEMKFSKKKFSINNSKFFYLDNEENVISIFPVSKILMNYKEVDAINSLTSKGELFTIPYSLNWKKNFNDKVNSTFLRLNKLNVKIENITDAKKSDLSIKNNIFFRSSELETNIFTGKDTIKIKSVGNSKLKNNKLSYEGEIFKNPFYLKANIEVEKLNFKKNIFNNNLLHNLFGLEQLYNENLSSDISLKVEKLIKNKLFNSSEILINFSNGNINFNNSAFVGDLGNLKLVNSNISNIKDDVIFIGNFKFNILSQKEFYRLFQISKKNRKKINNIYFDIDYNLTKNKIKISNLIFDPGKVKLEHELSDFLNENNDELKIDNWIDFKIFVKKIFVNYYEG